MKIQFGIVAVLALGLVACGQDDAQKIATAPAPIVEVVAEPVAPVVEEVVAVEEVVEESAPAVAEVTEEVAPEFIAPQETASVSGADLYATCVACHGAEGEGGVGPKLQGQSIDDLTQKLAIYKSGNDIGPMSGMMIPNATGLSDDDITAVSEYIAGL